MIKVHIERYYGYGSNEHYHVEVPSDFKFYKKPIIDKQNHYVSFYNYNEELFDKLDGVIGLYCYKVDDKMIVCLFNEPLGCFIHTEEVVSDDLNELADKMGDFLKENYFYEYLKASRNFKLNKDRDKIFHELDNSDSEEEKNAIIEKYSEILKDQLISVRKIIGFDGYNVKIVQYVFGNYLGQIDVANTLDIKEIDLNELFDNVLFDEEDYWSVRTAYYKISKDSSSFIEKYNELKKLIEN